MTRARTRRLLLRCALTDSTFERVTHQGRELWRGKCLHCRRKIWLTAAGDPLGDAPSDASVEHIVPRAHGGTDDVENLAIACRRCNMQKGTRHDHKRWTDPGLRALVEKLKEARLARYREPPPGLDLQTLS